MNSQTRNAAIVLGSAFAIIIVVLAIVALNPGSFKPQPGPGIEVGQFAPGFTIDDVNGTSWNLSAHRGQVVLLDFMGANCSSCATEMGQGSMQAVYNAHVSQGFTIISIDVGGPLGTQNPVDAWRFVRGLNADGTRRWDPGDWTVALDKKGVATVYGVGALPQKFLLDKTGKIVWKQLGIVPQADLDAAVRPLLA